MSEPRVSINEPEPEMTNKYIHVTSEPVPKKRVPPAGKPEERARADDVPPITSSTAPRRSAQVITCMMAVPTMMGASTMADQQLQRQQLAHLERWRTWHLARWWPWFLH